MSTQKSALKLAKKQHTGFGVASMILAIVSLVFVVFAVFISAFEDRTKVSVQYLIGLTETFAIMGSLVGLIYGCIGETSKETFKFTAHIGVVTNALLMGYHIFVIILGYGA